MLKKLLLEDFTKLSAQNLYKFKKQWSKKLGFMPQNSKLLSAYKALVKTKKLSPNKQFEQLVKIRKIRSGSGVTPLAVMTKPYPCPGQCIYCPLEKGMPKSYLSDEPASQRAKKANFNPYKQIKNRLNQLKKIGHPTDKVEIIVIGGTFSAYPENYKRQFFLNIFNALNHKKSQNLKTAQKLNETAGNRVVGLSIETRPDWINANEIKLLRKLGVTKIQMGVQALDSRILKTIRRGHSLKPIVKATQMLKNAGFKICYHFMPNLPGSNPKKDILMAQKMFKDIRYKPDSVKIYPCQVIPGTQLYQLWQAGEFKTYSDQDLEKVLTKIKLLTPDWVRIDRLVRDISKKWIGSGTIKTNMRQIIQNKLKNQGKSCQCIRCREIKHQAYLVKPQFKLRKIKNFKALEYFLSFEKGQKLFSLLRLRLPQKQTPVLFKELKNAAIIREVHTFGQAVPISLRQKLKTQHQGLGKKLIQKAERIAIKKGFSKIAVISAIGTRNYYCQLGYKLENLYMTKPLTKAKIKP